MTAALQSERATARTRATGPGHDATRYAIPRLPGAARLIVSPAGTQVAAETRCRYDAQLARVSVLGPTSRAVTLWVQGPPPVEVELDAASWSYLTHVRADTLTDRIVPAATMGMASAAFPADALGCARVAHALAAQRGHHGDHHGDAVTRGFAALVGRLDVNDVGAAAEMLGVSPHLLRRTTLRYFGFAPKLLLVRARFLSALEAFRRSGLRFDSVLAFGYFDSSHFLRDANRFLGTTPRRYLERIAALAPGEWDYAAAA
jgi:methylphosphotriester-DNA--protein-cysteine methyltransferase